MVTDNLSRAESVVEESRRLASRERATWKAFLMGIYGGVDPNHVTQVGETAHWDIRVLEEARRRLAEEQKDITDIRARNLVRRAMLRTLKERES